ncbi:MAG TPA: TetR/AcrR family transcriptional regulator [Anaerovoracaceae bacterium]|nr:TetR/AcrR family transcriptional regulator [Anaerovoracaceae bacterium]
MQKHTSRQLQAQKTKRKIYNAAVDLFNKHGFYNTTIEDISKKAGVSVGAFYHYYLSKSDIYHELFKKIDEFYQSTVEAEMVKEDAFDNIILFFKHYAAYNFARGTDAVKQLFNTENAQFLDQSRYMFRLLAKVIVSGQEKNQLTREMDSEAIKDFLLVAARGIVYDWLLNSGDYDMEAKMEEYISKLRPIFTA